MASTTTAVHRLCTRCWGSSSLSTSLSRSLYISSSTLADSRRTPAFGGLFQTVRELSSSGAVQNKKRVEIPDIEYPAGWGPTNSVKYEAPPGVEADSELLEADEDASNLMSSKFSWTPTGSGAYPKDWAALSSTPWQTTSQRVGAIGIKLGMTHTWDAWGDRIPLTAIQIQDNVVIEERTNTTTALVVAAVKHTKPQKLRKSLRNLFTSKEVACRRHVSQFKVSADALLPAGTVINVDHFVPGQFVDVISKTSGKGNAGVMKRHNMKGGNASHGATKHHRKMGATGGGQDPGRIWPGKRMAGHMGDVKALTHSLKAFKIDTRWNILYVKGAVSGKPGAMVKISDARRKPHAIPPPFPTALAGQVPEGIHFADVAASDPTMVLRG